MEPTRAGDSQGRSNLGRIIGGAVLAGVLVGGGAAGYLVLRGGGDDNAAVATDGTAGSTSGQVLSAEAGVAARAERSQFGPAGAGGLATAASKVAGADALELGCGPADGDNYQPTAEEVATSNADTDALAAVFSTYGIPYTRTTDPQGFSYLEWDSNDVVAQSVSDSFWADRYPATPVSQADLDRARAENDVIARHLDEAGVAYTRSTGADGWEVLDYDYEDPKAQAAVDAAYTELYPPVPPTAEDKATMKADNDKLAAAFDKAGVAYTRKSDELGWEWIEWDYDDPAIQAKVDAVFTELYPPTEGECLAAEGSGTAASASGVATADDATSVTIDGEGSEGEGIDDFVEPTPEQIARRDAEAAALVKGFTDAGVRNELLGESPYQSVQFDINDKAAVPVVANILATRGG